MRAGEHKNVAVCSACLLGIECRYDGKSSLNEGVLSLTRDMLLVPVCPEQLGGLPTPREKAELREGRVVTISGRDVTSFFERGARAVERIAELVGARIAIMKQYSPSCGSGKIYDGTFSGTVVPGDGITTRKLKEKGIRVYTEEDLEVLERELYGEG